jgi:hypothetical protein
MDLADQERGQPDPSRDLLQIIDVVLMLKLWRELRFVLELVVICILNR